MCRRGGYKFIVRFTPLPPGIRSRWRTSSRNKNTVAALVLAVDVTQVMLSCRLISWIRTNHPMANSIEIQCSVGSIEHNCAVLFHRGFVLLSWNLLFIFVLDCNHYVFFSLVFSYLRTFLFGMSRVLYIINLIACHAILHTEYMRRWESKKQPIITELQFTIITRHNSGFTCERELVTELVI